MEHHIDHPQSFEANQTLTELQAIASKWTAQFENKPTLDLKFAVTSCGRVTLNGIPLGVSILEIDPKSIYVDAEWFGFSTHNSANYDFKVCWPFEESHASLSRLHIPFPSSVQLKR